MDKGGRDIREEKRREEAYSTEISFIREFQFFCHIQFLVNMT